MQHEFIELTFVLSCFVSFPSLRVLLWAFDFDYSGGVVVVPEYWMECYMASADRHSCHMVSSDGEQGPFQ